MSSVVRFNFSGDPLSTRSDRQSFLGPGSEALLSHAKVGIVGLCGGGSHIAQQLAHIGVGKMVLCDHDYPEASNSNRMVGLAHEHVHGSGPRPSKVEVIRDMVLRINPDIRVTPVSSPWQEQLDRFKDCQVIFGCVDTYAARSGLERFARRYLIPYIDIGMDVHDSATDYFITGQVILSLPSKPCMTCMGFLTEENLAKEAADYGRAGGKPQVIWPNGVLASTAVGKFMGLVTPWSRQLLPSLYTQYDGNRELLKEDPRVDALDLEGRECPHFPMKTGLGDLG